MDFIVILETFGLPIFLVFILGWYVNRQNKFIQQDLTGEIDKLRDIIIELINQSKINQLSTAELKGGLTKMVRIFTSLIKNINKGDKKNG